MLGEKATSPGAYGLGVRATRTAELLTCRALEDWLDETCGDWSTSTASGRLPTTASKLIAIGAIHGDELGERVRMAWHGLSRSVHLHSYELAPSENEVRGLVRQVRELED